MGDMKIQPCDQCSYDYTHSMFMYTAIHNVWYGDNLVCAGVHRHTECSIHIGMSILQCETKRPLIMGRVTDRQTDMEAYMSYGGMETTSNHRCAHAAVHLSSWHNLVTTKKCVFGQERNLH